MHNRPEIEILKNALHQCLLPDQVRIGRHLARFLAACKRGANPSPSPLSRWLAEANASVKARQLRTQILSGLQYPPELPITAHRLSLVEAIRTHRVVVVAGETGSGKTTQIPKMCLEAGFGMRARIGCTQPRRLAAISISRRLAEELQVEWGGLVGCKIRFATDCAPETSIKVMTDGILLAEIQQDPLLCEYEVILIDEAHERSLNIDFLLGYLKLLLQRRDDLKLIITSATIDTARFADAFDHAPIVEVSGRLYPVEVRYQPIEAQSEEAGDVTYIDAAVHAVQDILTESNPGDSLVFMPSERDIRETCDRLQALDFPRLDIVPLFGRLTSAEQQRVFVPGKNRRVVVATNIAETSLTVPRIRYVVDTGLARISRYQATTRSKRLPIEPIAQSSANQRQGRCGRLSNGICIRLYAQDDFAQRPLFAEPEILRGNLADVILRLKAHQLGEIETFPFLDPPTPAAIHGAYVLLRELGALDAERQLTSLGRELARLPVDPSIGRMILEARQERVMAEVLVIAAGLSIQDPRERPFERKDLADAAHRRFQDPRSDFLALLNIWNVYHDTWESLRTQNQLRRFCKDHFLSYVRMREWVDIQAQLAEALADLNRFEVPSSDGPARNPPTPENPSPTPMVAEPERGTAHSRSEPGDSAADRHYAAIHRSILSGLIGQVAKREERNLYRVVGDRKVMIFPGSTRFEKTAVVKPASGKKAAPVEKTHHSKAEWIVAGEIFETSRTFARTVAIIDPAWIEELAPHLCRHTYHDPRWDARAGRVLVTERINLRGLVLQERRADHSRVNPNEAAEIFIRAALLEEDLPVDFPFLEHNRKLRQKIELWQTRLPHRVVPDLDEALFQFYRAQLGTIASLPELNRLKNERNQPDFLRATEADLLGEHARDFSREDYPDTIEVQGRPVAIEYAYAPGEDRDGVTFRLTTPLARLIEPDQLDWLIPALREERVRQLLYALPKSLRRPLMPLPAAAREIIQSVQVSAGSYLAAMSEFVKRRYGVEIPPAAWPVKSLPAFLQPRFEIRDQPDKPAAVGRDLAALKEALRRGESDQEKARWRQAAERWERYGLTEWNMGELPVQRVIGEQGGCPMLAFPGLQVEDEAVNLRLFTTEAEARLATLTGVPRLAELTLLRELAWVQKDLRALERAREFYVTLGPVEELTQTAWENLRRYVFAQPPLPPITPETFAAFVETSRQKLPGLAHQLVTWTTDILRKRQEALLCRQPYAGMKDDLDQLVPRQFLRLAPYDQLKHLPRYLQALLMRAQRAAVNPAKDREKFLRVQPYLAAARELRLLDPVWPEMRARLHEFLWWVEEYKVSCFAQELGTAVSVSPKKLDAALASLRTQLQAKTP